jgi:hypothetical protein
MAVTRSGLRRTLFAAVVAFAVVAALATLRHIVIGHPGSTSPGNGRPSLARTTWPSAVEPLKGYGVYIQCLPAERRPLVEAVSSKGGRVRSSLAVDTDLVVIGSDVGGRGYADVRQDAKALHIPVIDEARLAFFHPPVVQ